MLRRDLQKSSDRRGEIHDPDPNTAVDLEVRARLSDDKPQSAPFIWAGSTFWSTSLLTFAANRE